MKKITQQTRFLIVGLGLMGGSYAMGLTRKGYHVKAISRRQETIDYALEHGLIAEGSTDVREDFLQEADVLIFALYPEALLDWLKENGHRIASRTLVTDVTGVKSSIVPAVRQLLPPDVEFIAAHPMAGKEMGGVENADDAIFRMANFIVTPTADNSPEAIAACKKIAEILEFSDISILSPKEHDQMIAYLSQLAHVIAVALMTGNDAPNLERFTGDSFRDLTRIARINEDMWTELFFRNQEALLQQTDLFLAEMQKLREALAQKDENTLKSLMRKASRRRALFDRRKPEGAASDEDLS